MLRHSATRGFTLVESLVALALMLSGLAGASLVLLQGVQYERESSNRRTAIRFAASLADELRAHDPDIGTLAADAPAIVAWIAAVEAALPAGSQARVEIGGATPPDYRILIEWPVAGAGSQHLVLGVTT